MPDELEPGPVRAQEQEEQREPMPDELALQTCLPQMPTRPCVAQLTLRRPCCSRNHLQLRH